MASPTDTNLAARIVPAPNCSNRKLEAWTDKYCVLCRANVPWSDDRENPGCPAPRGNHQDWEFDVLALLNPAVENTFAPRVFAVRTNLGEAGVLSDANEAALGVSVAGKVVRRFWAVQKIYESNGANTTMPIVLVHTCCWKIARGQVPNLSTRVLYRLGQQTARITRFYRWNPGFKEFPIENAGILPCFASTNASRFFFRCSHLPVEIQQDIQRELTDSLAGSLLAAEETATSLYPVIEKGANSYKPLNYYLVPSGQGQGSVGWVDATTTSIFGNQYLRRLNFVNQASSKGLSNRAINVKIDEVLGVDFVLGLHGLSAIRFCYPNEGFSSWIGDYKNGWSGTFRCGNIETLRITHDDLKVIRIDVDDTQRKAIYPWPGRALWDYKPVVHEGHVFYSHDSGGWRSGIFPNYFGWRLRHYLPLENDGVYATGITVYMEEKFLLSGPVGITVYGKTDLTIGSTRGLAIHFSLQKGEHIVSTLISPGITDYGPFPAMITTFNRAAFFSPGGLSRSYRGHWNNGSYRHPGKVIGLVFEAPANTNGFFRDGGCVTSPVPPREEPLFANRYTHRFLAQNKLSYASSANLSNIRLLQVQKIGARCVGLRIEHHSGVIETLGQWDPHRCTVLRGRTFDVYNSANAREPLSAVSFHYHRGIPANSNDSFIADITAGEGNPEQWERFVWRETETPDICWLFSETHDCIDVCKPEMISDLLLAAPTPPRSIPFELPFF